MRIVVAPQAFKGSADAHDVAEAIADGLRAVWPEAAIDRVPVADGGEGTVRALVEAMRGEYRETEVQDPLGRHVRARWGRIADGTVAVLEMAAASGLPLLAPSERDPLRASSFGTGELILAAARSGPQSVVVGAGGSATNDGGAGMLRALGLRFLDATGHELEDGGVALAHLSRIAGQLDPALEGRAYVVASDVRNPLTGPEGASAVFGPQKGASPEEVRVLDAALRHYAEIVARHVGRDLRDRPGAGAAGGLGFALMAFLDAEMRSGAEFVLDACDFDARARGASLVVTGEGRLDGQSRFGKASVTVARRARAARVPVAAVVGSLGEGAERVVPEFDVVETLAAEGRDLATLMREWRPLVRDAAIRVARSLQPRVEVDKV